MKRVAYGSARGSFGLWVSKPGFDVDSDSEFNLAFSSNFQHLQKMLSGTASLGAMGTATTDPAISYDVFFGGSYNPCPIVAAAAFASSHVFTIPNFGTWSPYSYLDGVWHTPCWEAFAQMNNNNIGYNDVYGPHVSWSGGWSQQKGSIRFSIHVFQDRVRFWHAVQAPVTIKYMIYKPAAS